MVTAEKTAEAHPERRSPRTSIVRTNGVEPEVSARPEKPPASSEVPGQFLHRLESLRGIAALMVAGQHSFAVLVPSGWQATAHQFTWLVCNGHAAVTLFFVLSGVVLGLSLARSRTPFAITCATFAVRRVFRIWPAHFVACLVIAVAIVCLDKKISYAPQLSGWFTGHWVALITVHDLFQNMFLVDHRLNVPTWTLEVELVCSLALPLIFFLHSHARSVMRGGLLWSLVVWSLIGSGGSLSAWSFMFYLGLLVPTVGPRVMRRLPSGGKATAWAMGLSALALCSAHFYGHYPRWGNIVEATAAATLISAILYAPEVRWSRVLDWPVTRFYGRISFSFYLYHMVCLYLLAKGAMTFIPAGSLAKWFLLSATALLLASATVATPLASLSRRFIERPAIDLSKRICAHLERIPLGRLLVRRPRQTGLLFKPTAEH